MGAGAVAAAGLITLCRTLPTIAGALADGLRNIRKSKRSTPDVPSSSGGAAATRTGGVPTRTEHDLPPAVVLGGSVALIALLWVFLEFHPVPGAQVGAFANLAASFLVVLFGFLFVTVSARIVGIVGSSASPVSGMTIATLMATAAIFLVKGWTAPAFGALAITIGGIVCIAASNAGDTAQDLKTGYLIGATPWKQQLAIMIGVVISVVSIGATLNAMNTGLETFQRLPRPIPINIDALPDGVRSSGHFTRDHITLSGPTLPITAPAAATTPSPIPNTPDTTPPEAMAPAPETTGQIRTNAAGSEPQSAASRMPASTESKGGTVGTPIAGKEELPAASSYLLLNAIGSTTLEDGKYLYNPATGTIDVQWIQGIGSEKAAAPQGRLMATVINGILSRKLPWSLVLLGVFLVVAVELLGIRSLTFAVGAYLSIATTLAIFIGGLMRWMVDRAMLQHAAKQAAATHAASIQLWHADRGAWLAQNPHFDETNPDHLDPATGLPVPTEVTPSLDAESEISPGSLFASGLIAAGGIVGLLGVCVKLYENFFDRTMPRFAETNPLHHDWVSVLAFAALAFSLYYFARRPLDQQP